ncbi:MAG TPA: YidC/Oxa1 family insertase periplasmic-domain containing protein [Pirellulaceae bacterium]|nr:YidC/Oxa1 family insertase periplasmic-domain containing protein [Pirellulaceae bacterium]HMO90746.1 YidC/Oxa1 family insertase periplasmic-domain containing protein [Pirellulaceae bacterium]HMP67997.1 YidC/Oxa1 family insertase periplasmic-domain containing protein [Pirellulaceae bacterium]
MERRKGSFLLYAALIFLGLLLFQSMFPPPQQPDQAKADAENQDQVERLADDPLNRADGGAVEADETQVALNDTATDDVEAVQDEHDLKAEALANEPTRFFTIGQFDANGLYKNVVTLCNQGAAVRRVELNSRRPNGKFLYRDLETDSAYIGHLELSNSLPSGAQINVVVPGTPASEAGLRAGDVITHAAGEPIGRADQLDEVLHRTKPGREITIGFIRDGQELSANVTTTEIPLTLIGVPQEPHLNSPEEFYQPFQISLYVQKGGVFDVWPELDATLRGGMWESDVRGQDEVRFKRVISRNQLKSLEIEGPIEITKIYRAAKDDPSKPKHENYNFHLDIEIRNLGSAPQPVNLEIVGPTRTSIEGWWYQHKIHGRSSAIFSAAGARDIVVSTKGMPFSFWGGPEIVKKQLSDRYTYIIDPAKDQLGRTIQFAAVDTHYFTMALIPENELGTQEFVCFNGYARPVIPIPAETKYQRLTDLTFQLFSDSIVLNSSTEDSENVFRQSFKVFAGPKVSYVLDEHGLSDCRTFGWFAVFSKPLIWLLGLFYSIIPNYGIAIILLTVLVRLAMMPISRRAAKSALMMQALQPEMKKITEKYKDDFQKRGEAQNALLKKYNCHPLGGCMLMFVQLPIFIGLYRGLSVDIGLRDKPLIPGLNWCSDLAGPDQLFYWKNWGLSFLFDEAGWLGPYFNILPLVTVVLFLIQQKLFTPPPTDDQQRMMQKMMTFMMLFMGVLFFKVSSGLCIYFITSSIWGIVERQLIPKPKLPEHLTKNISADDILEGVTQEVKSTGAAYTSENKQLDERRRLARERNRRLKEKDAKK